MAQERNVNIFKGAGQRWHWNFVKNGRIMAHGGQGGRGYSRREPAEIGAAEVVGFDLEKINVLHDDRALRYGQVKRGRHIINVRIWKGNYKP